MVNPVWIRIEQELERRKARHSLPGTWADLAASIGQSKQRVGNWKSRGVPARHHADVARALGWTVDQLLGLEPEPAPAARPAEHIADPLHALDAAIKAAPEPLRALAYAAIVNWATGRADIETTAKAVSALISINSSTDLWGKPTGTDGPQ